MDSDGGDRPGWSIDFEAVLQASPHPYIVMTPDFTIVWANAAYLRVTGSRLDAIGGRMMLDAFPSTPDETGREGAAQLRASLERVVREGAADTLAMIRYAVPGPDGQLVERFWSATHTPIFDDAGILRLILQQTDDVTELHQLRAVAEAASAPPPRMAGEVFRRAQAAQAEKWTLDRERQMLRRLFEQAPAFVAFLRGPDHVFEIANEAYRQLIGRDDILGKPVREVLPEIGTQGYPELLDRVYRTGEPYIGRGVHARLQRRPGVAPDDVYMDLIYQPIVEADGTVSGIFVLGSETTAQKLAQDELQRHKDNLEALVRARTSALEASEAERRQAEAALRQAQKMEAIGQLTGGVAHDFNNLLQVIGGNLQLLDRRLAQEGGREEARQRLRAAEDAVQRGAKLSAQLLAFARRQPLEPRALNLGRLVRSMDDLLRRAIGESIEIETVVAGGLWNTLVDPNQVQNAILNLALNARDAMGGTGRLTIEAGNALLDDLYAAQHVDIAPGQYVMLAVSDTGCGMRADDIERAFEPFFTTKRDGHGTGLGLSMVYGFVKQSGGHVKIYSELGEGTTVKIYLPRSHSAEDAPIALPETPSEGGNERILVVEDDLAVQATVVDLLVDLGYRVIKAPDAAGALEILRRSGPVDLVFSDVVMPGPIRAPEMARRIREMMPETAILFTSGYTENAIVHGGRLDPGVHLLSKPYRREDLARKVRQVLELRVPAPAEDPGDPPEARPEALRVLLVEDEPIIRMTTAGMLADLGHRVVAVGDGASAFAALEAVAYDILFTDLGLPDVTGIALARDAVRRLPALGVVVASGYGDGGHDLDDLAAIMLPKPYAEQDIADAVERAHRLGAGRPARPPG